MSDTNSASTGGIGFLGALTILFIALKLMGHIAWSWVWILSPSWIPIAAVVLGFLIYLPMALFSDRRRLRREAIRRGARR